MVRYLEDWQDAALYHVDMFWYHVSMNICPNCEKPKDHVEWEEQYEERCGWCW